MTGYALFAAAIAAVAIGTIAVFWMLHMRAERKRWARYDPPRGSGEIKAVVCPHCRQRSYSPRANRERFCPNCERRY